MRKKSNIYSWASVFIFFGLLLIVFLLYLIGIEIYKVQSLERVFTELSDENTLIEERNNALQKESVVRSTVEYIDRFAKENWGFKNPTEIEIKLPEKVNTESTNNTPPLFFFHEPLSIREQWINVFFHQETNTQ